MPPTMQELNDSVDRSRSLRVFLCHSSNDKPGVRILYQKLRAEEGIAPWLDEEDILAGQNWSNEIENEIGRTDIVIVCLSKGSITKVGYVQREITYALDIADLQPEGAIFLIPLKLEECLVPKRLRRWHWVDFFEERGYERLVKALRARAGAIGITVGGSSTGAIAILTRGNAHHGADSVNAISKYGIGMVGRVVRTSFRLTSLFGVKPSPEAISKAVGIAAYKVREIIRDPQALASHNHLADAEEGQTITDALPAQEREIVRLRYGLDSDHNLTIKEVAAKFGITRERVKQVETRALQKFRPGAKYAAEKLVEEPSRQEDVPKNQDTIQGVQFDSSIQLSTSVDPSETGPLPSLEGFEELQALVAANPNDVGLHMALASAYAQVGDIDTQLRVYRRVLKKAGVSNKILRLIAEELSDYEAGLIGHPHFHQARGDLYMKQNRFQQAIEEYNKIG